MFHVSESLNSIDNQIIVQNGMLTLSKHVKTSLQIQFKNYENHCKLHALWWMLCLFYNLNHLNIVFGDDDYAECDQIHHIFCSCIFSIPFFSQDVKLLYHGQADVYQDYNKFMKLLLKCSMLFWLFIY